MNEPLPNKLQMVEDMWDGDTGIRDLFREAHCVGEARWRFVDYLDRRQLTRDSEAEAAALRVLRNVVSERCESQSGAECLSYLVRLAAGPDTSVLSEVGEGFLQEFKHLFATVAGSASGCRGFVPFDLGDAGGEVKACLGRYASGLDEGLCSERESNRRRIMGHFGASEEQWGDWRWHIDNAIRDSRTVSHIVDLDPEERVALERAESSGIPFSVTPYYASLMEGSPGVSRTRSLRIQVFPSSHNVEQMVAHRGNGVKAFDYMGELEMSPVESLVRRYPAVAVIKPHHGCAQLCTYCQRNWQDEEDADVEPMLEWLDEHDEIAEVLVTGGDAFAMSDDRISFILERLARMGHIRRIRFCTRMPVVLPQRVTDELADLVASFVSPGRRDVCVVTHFQHVTEVTPDAVRAVRMFLGRGVTVYNQSVFTMQNARRFEMAALRRELGLAGVIPYYTFAAKDKPESRDIRVPIARLLQERHEESRMLPGLSRTDALVFNIPRWGKVELSSNRHEVIMIAPSGARIYSFEPWNGCASGAPRFIHEDIPICEFLARMKGLGEDPADYGSIWHYY
jgi:lysine 2,3-aminomutase